MGTVVTRGRAPRLAGAALAIWLGALGGPALAHAPIPGVGAFWNGVAHPVLVLPHLLFLAGFGLLLGQNVPRASRTGLAAFGLALAPAVALAQGTPPPPAALATATAAAGLLVALGRAHPVPVVALALAGAALVGLDSAAEGAAGAEALARGGALLGALLVVILAGGLAAALNRPWERVGLRVGGSWIAAAALLALAVEAVEAGTG